MREIIINGRKYFMEGNEFSFISESGEKFTIKIPLTNDSTTITTTE